MSKDAKPLLQSRASKNQGPAPYIRPEQPVPASSLSGYIWS